MSNATNYAHQQLASTGFVIVDPGVAFAMRPDLFASGQDTGVALGIAKRQNELSASRLNAGAYLAELKELV